MARLNDNYLKLKAGYLFPEIRRRTEAFTASHPDAEVIRMGSDPDGFNITIARAMD